MVDLTPRYRVGEIVLTKASSDSKITFGQPTVELSIALAPVLQGPQGDQGPVGPQGPPGDLGSIPDPGDLTLIFDNNLI